MGKKRQFKRGDDKKGSGSSSNSAPYYKPMPPGIVGPGSTYIDNRVDPDNYEPPLPPIRLSDEEIIEETRARQAAEQEQLETQEKVISRRAKVSQSDPVNATISVDDLSEQIAEHEAHPEDTVEPVVPRKKKRVSEIIEELRNDVELEATRRHLVYGAWKARDKVYQQLFGKPAYVLPDTYGPPSTEVPEGFATRDHSKPETFNLGDPEEHLAVLAYAPDPQAPYWKYVTAGLATPWVQYEPLQVSGFGCELMIKSPVDAPWAAQLLRTLAYYIFNMVGTLSQGVRLALNDSIDAGFPESKLRNAFIWYADEAPDTLYELPSGLFSVLMVIGMTDDERAFADSIEEYGTWSLQALLRQAGHEQVTDPKRPSAMEHENINAIKMSVRNFAETFRANRAGLFTADHNDL